MKYAFGFWLSFMCEGKIKIRTFKVYSQNAPVESISKEKKNLVVKVVGNVNSQLQQQITNLQTIMFPLKIEACHLYMNKKSTHIR